MKSVILDTLIDSAKLLPFLFITFILIELFEHKFSKKSKDIIKKSGKFGPVLGSILGIIPQCGFSVCASNLYITRIISIGTLFAVYLSTSDEMIPLLIAEQAPASLMIKILVIKLILGMVYGLIIDFILRKKEKESFEICDHEHCDCEKSIVLASIKHTLNVLLFIVICSFVINIIMHYLGEEYLSSLLLKNNIFSYFITSLIGLIPNCASSVILTELYLNSLITFGALLSGLLVGSGIALLVLIKENKDIKETIKIITTLYILGLVSGIIIDLLKL